MEPKFFALGSYSEEQAMKNLKRIREAVEDKPALKWLMPKKKSATWDIKELNFSNGCTIQVFGVGSSVRGGHFHKVVFDDPTKDHWTISIEQQKNFLFGVIVPAVRKTGQLIVCGTPVSLEDLLFVLENHPKFPLFKFPAHDENNKPLWAEQYTYEDLMDKRDLVGSFMFAREYLLKRMNSEDAKFKQDWFKYYKDKPDVPYYRIMTVDPRVDGKDAMGVVITDNDEKDNTYVIYSKRHMGTVKECVSEIFDIYDTYKPDVFGVETFIFQKLFKLLIEMEQEKRGMNFPVVELEKEGARKTYTARVMGLQPKIQNGKLMFRENQDSDLVNELLGWDHSTKNNKDDLIMALAHQVPLWDKPSPKTVKEPSREGTFLEAFEALNRGNHTDFERQWSDFT